jgi:hypothetical protein
MPKQTIAERVIQYLTTARKAKEVGSKSTKYRCFKTPGAAGSTYWVSRNGAIRAGTTVSESVSLTDMIHRKMKVWERHQEMTENINPA